ncbi:uncharacterized protein LOC113225814 [Hyposmocoma kahamanoa]|uniref:uncharacterized protein LOC113225814 n=1 Tax=Hyposmocoma kahamanoa TaxID=1477025 RepID=UPI000E6D82DB|nr:uncharacterized protein LOC113225814 [Hyposmocoma kahamanoa]
MVFGAAGKKSPENVLPIMLNGIPLKRVSHFKYLGHYIADDLKDSMGMERERRTLSVRANMLLLDVRRRTLLRLRRFCSASAMFAEARVDGFVALLRKKSASLLKRIRGSSNGLLKTIADRNAVAVASPPSSLRPDFVV